MLGSAKMFCGVFVFRRIAAADVAATQAQAEMHPTVAHLKALFAAFCLCLDGRLDAIDLIEMGAGMAMRVLL